MLLEQFTVPEAVDAFIKHELCKDNLELLRTAKTGSYTQCHRQANTDLDAVCRALEWRQKLTDQIQSGTRLPTGELVSKDS